MYQPTVNPSFKSLKKIFEYFFILASADKISIHPKYVNGQNFESNIAVIRVSNQIFFSQKIII